MMTRQDFLDMVNGKIKKLAETGSDGLHNSIVNDINMGQEDGLINDPEGADLMMDMVEADAKGNN